jgi:hypothetical protein
MSYLSEALLLLTDRFLSRHADTLDWKLAQKSSPSTAGASITIFISEVISHWYATEEKRTSR